MNGLVMFSGGLDSVCATHLLLSQGIPVTALHFVLPFYSGLGLAHAGVMAAAERLGVQVRIIEEGEEYLPVIKNPQYGYGKNANPCVDCRIHRLLKAKKIMEEEGASFIATGEVIGQRPMSQRLDCLHKIENQTGLKGRLLRPLSAKLLPPTIPETEGLIDRAKFFGIAGRGRGEQLAYARAHGLVHGTPAGGCFLTDKIAAGRLGDLASNEPEYTIDDFKLLAHGRHFRLSPACKLVVGRDEADNAALEILARAGDQRLYLAHSVPGPFALLRGARDAADVAAAASIVVRYSKLRTETRCGVVVACGGAERTVEAAAMGDEACRGYMV